MTVGALRNGVRRTRERYSSSTVICTDHGPSWWNTKTLGCALSLSVRPRGDEGEMSRMLKRITIRYDREAVHKARPSDRSSQIRINYSLTVPNEIRSCSSSVFHSFLSVSSSVSLSFLVSISPDRRDTRAITLRARRASSRFELKKKKHNRVISLLSREINKCFGSKSIIHAILPLVLVSRVR